MIARVLNQGSLEHLFAELRRITANISGDLPRLGSSELTEEDEYRGLYVTEEEVSALLAEPGLFRAEYTSLERLNPPETDHKDPEFLRLVRLQKLFGLSPFELDVMLLALAPEVDLRYEKLFIYLHDDVTRRRPSIDLALRLLCPGLAGQVAARRCFDPDAPLLRYRLIELSEEGPGKSPSLLARSIKVDDGIVAYLLGTNQLDPRLRPLVENFNLPTNQPFITIVQEVWPRLATLAHEGYLAVLTGSDEAGKRELASQICHQLRTGLLIVDCTQLAGTPRLETVLRLLERESYLLGKPLYWSAYDTLLPKEGENQPLQEARRLVLRLLNEQSGLSFISTAQGLPPLLSGSNRREFHLELSLPGYRERQQLWEQALGPAASGLDLESLSSRFLLSSGQIRAAAITAHHTAVWRGASYPALSDLEAACRSHSSQKLGTLARKVATCYGWGDLVLPLDQFSMLRELYEQVRHRALVYEKWGFESKLALGKGLNVIFAGPSGTGKTMSASIIAGELGMDLYKIDLSSVVSKYIGETEKNLEKIFTEASEGNAVLFFDEADAIFGKRSEVKDAHDRYANIETGYLLQRMEEYEGIVILATNLRKNLDEAFIRRMHFIIEFPFPEEEDRYLIWQKVFPAELPISAEVDLRFMARQFKIAGGNIKNIALAAAFLAAGDTAQGSEPALKMAHLIRATRREYQKIGKLCTETDFGPFFPLLKEYERKNRQK